MRPIDPATKTARRSSSLSISPQFLLQPHNIYRVREHRSRCGSRPTAARTFEPKTIITNNSCIAALFRWWRVFWCCGWLTGERLASLPPPRWFRAARRLSRMCNTDAKAKKKTGIQCGTHFVTKRRSNNIVFCVRGEILECSRINRCDFVIIYNKKKRTQFRRLDNNFEWVQVLLIFFLANICGLLQRILSQFWFCF